jgi:single-strand selective monofunctional uracil DNA glycosylase
VALLDAAARLRDACDALSLRGIAHVYNPLAYAWEPHAQYVARYGEQRPPGRVLLVGMNPGPWGMGQTGVPFGDVAMVRDWMGITGRVHVPPALHPKRPVTGFGTTRSEPSGSRLYGWAKERFGTADAFFDRFFVVNYCPLLFFDEAGKNLTPPDLKRADAGPIEAVCDAHLAEAIVAVSPSWVLGVGGFAEARVRNAVESR